MNAVMKYKYTLLATIVILIALLVPSSTFQQVPILFRGEDKLVHLALFLWLGVSFILEYTVNKHPSPTMLSALGLLTCFAVITETLQLFTKTRHFEVMDMVFDVLGSAIAFLAIKFFRKHYGGRNSK
jgi:VanZ family protein